MNPRALVLSALLLAAGCGSPCVDLAQKICACRPSKADQDSCLQDAKNQSSAISPSKQDEQTCAALVDKCDCTQLSTPQGKQNCGLAR